MSKIMTLQPADEICEIKVALKEADAGDFADDAEVAALASKWKVTMDDCFAHGAKDPGLDRAS